MTSKERDAILEEYKNGNFQVLLNCAILTEGFDSPETECIIIARPTQSLGLYQQMVGRGLRKFPNKNKCIVIDFNDKNHSICNSATLLRDAEEELKDNTISTNKKLSKPLDREINQELQSAHLEHDLYGESFYWDKDGRTYTLKGKDNISLIVTPQNGKYYRVIFIKPEEPRVIIAKNLDFSYAFSIAQDFAKKYKKDVFILKDKDAYWRNLNKLGYKNSFDQLTRGQASDWIDHLLKQ
jgi:superfamily II DNA or RNA helicase